MSLAYWYMGVRSFVYLAMAIIMFNIGSICNHHDKLDMLTTAVYFSETAFLNINHFINRELKVLSQSVWKLF